MEIKKVINFNSDRNLAHLEERHFIPAALMLEYRAGLLDKELSTKIREFLAADLQDLQSWAGSVLGDEANEIAPVTEQELRAWEEVLYDGTKLSAKRRIEIDRCVKACFYHHFQPDNQVISSKIRSLADVVFLKRFEAYSEYYPSSSAIKWKERTLTYKEVNERSNALAHHLIKNGIKKGDLIGTFLNRTPNWIVSILGIWKAGAAFVALDPTIPAGTFKVRASYVERFNHLINEVGMKYIITDKLLSARISNLPLIYVDDIQFDYTENPPVSIVPDDLAYIIYTSGSTGKPKGVQILHKGLTACLEGHRECVDLTNRSVMAQYASSGFDAWIAEMLILGIGGTLAIIPDEIRLDSEGLEQYSQLHNINVVILTPQLLRKLDPNNFSSWRALFIVGEKFSWEFAERWMSNTLQVVNGYGLTETTICTTLENLNALRLNKEALSYQKNEYLRPFLPIGCPILGTNIQLFVPLEDTITAYKPAKLGEEGEVFISGVSLSPGYCGEAKKINEDRFLSIDGIRYYMTGDKAVSCGYNRFIVIGRYNRVLKFDAKRIDLDGLENILLSHPAVAPEGVACLADEKMDETSILIIFLEPKDLKNLPSSDSIKEHLQINDIRTAGIPFELYFKEYGFANDKTPNGKKDYRKLTDEYKALRKVEKDKVEHKNTAIDVFDDDIFFKVIKLWSQVLPNNKELNQDSNFFESGGSSVSLMLLLENFRKEFQIDKRLLTPSIMFDTPTIELQATLIRNFLNPMKPIILTKNDAKPLQVIYCMPSILGKAEWDYHKMATKIEEFCPTIQFVAFENRPVASLIHSMEGIAIDYVSSILKDEKRRQSPGPIFVLGWSSGGNIAIEVVNQLQRIKIRTYCYVIDTVSPFILQQLKHDSISHELAVLAKIIAKKCNLNDFIISVDGIKKESSIINKIEYIFNELLKHEIPHEIRKIIEVARVIRLCEQVYMPIDLPDFVLFKAEDQALKNIINLSDSLNWPIKDALAVQLVKNVNHFTILLDPFFQKSLVNHVENPTKNLISRSILKIEKEFLTNETRKAESGSLFNISLSKIVERSREVRKKIRSKESRMFSDHLVKGNIKKLKSLLDKNKNLASLQIELNDLGGRKFSQKTALQYSICALDIEMWTLIIGYLSSDEIKDQLIALLLDPDRTFQTVSAHNVLIQYMRALKKYSDNYDLWDREKRARCMCLEVGGAQRSFYAWMIHMITEDGDDVAWTAKEVDRAFHRDPEEWNIKTWLACSEEKHCKLGIEPNLGPVGIRGNLNDAGFAWCRGRRGVAGIEMGFKMERSGMYEWSNTDKHDYEVGSKLLSKCLGELKKLCEKYSCIEFLQQILSGEIFEKDYLENVLQKNIDTDTASKTDSPLISYTKNQAFWQEKNSDSSVDKRVENDADSEFHTDITSSVSGNK